MRIFSGRGFLLSVISLAAAVAAAGCAGNSATTSHAPPPVATKEAAPPQQKIDFSSGVLFDGKILHGWEATDFPGRGAVTVTNGQIHLGMGYMTGINFTGAVPKMNYEISLEAMRTDGSDFFCGLTFPVGDAPCSLIVGGWGGGVVGLSSIDGDDASQNETTQYMQFESNRWYRVRVRVTPGKIESWIDQEKVADVDTEGKRLSVRLEVEASRPLGIATWNTAAALRNLQLKRL